MALGKYILDESQSKSPKSTDEYSAFALDYRLAWVALRLSCQHNV